MNTAFTITFLIMVENELVHLIKILISNLRIFVIDMVWLKKNIQHDNFIRKQTTIGFRFGEALPLVVLDLSVVIWFNYLPYKLRYSMKSKKSFTNTWCALIHLLPYYVFFHYGYSKLIAQGKRPQPL